MKKKLSVIAASALVISSLSACMNSNNVENQTINTYPSSQSIVTEISETSSDVTTSSETSEMQEPSTLETAPHTNPLLEYAIDNPDQYALNAYNIVCPSDYKIDVKYGFDNPYTIAKLQEYAYEVTGVQDNSLTLSDVSYFQYTSYLNNYTSVKFVDGFYPIEVEGVRAILTSQGLRFGIDEIPATYLQERFPRFYYDAMVFNATNKALVDSDLTIKETVSMENIWDVNSDCERDFKLFRACLEYNLIRSSYMYNNPYNTAPIQQVRDAATGKNILMPTEDQIQELQQDINSIPGCENIDIYKVEDRQSFYDCYGYYPEELLDARWEGNTKEGFQEYYNGLSSSDQYEIYAVQPPTFVYTYSADTDSYVVTQTTYDYSDPTEKGKGKSR